MTNAPIALVPEKANEQHYELPPEFFAAILGPQRKYSCCYWPPEVQTLEHAEIAALGVTSERAQLADGQEILELGCGWGSLTLWMAERFPHSHITAISNSVSQKRYIDGQAARRHLSNLRVVTTDINDFEPTLFGASHSRFDRVVSVEIFEHMRNYELLLKRIASWLIPNGKLFVHAFCHREHAYSFETEGAANWMGRHFFTGGMMPSSDLLRRFDRHLEVERDWTWDGTHYRRTAEAWLENFDVHERDLMPILGATYGPAQARRWFHRWRLFFLAVAELFGFESGSEWFVVHSLLTPKKKDMGKAK